MVDDNQQPRLSYKDICMQVNGGRHAATDSEEEEAWSAGEDFSEDEDEENEDPAKAKTFNPLRPKVSLSKEEIREARKPWVNSVIIKLLGRRINMKFLQQRLLKMWNPAGELALIDLENDYYLVRFSEKADVMKVLLGGPWMMLDHYLVVQRWRPEFRPFEDELKRVAVWIRIPGLPIEYYDRKVLWRIGNCLGHTIKVDGNTLRRKGDSLFDNYITERAKFARVCIEVDLRKTLVSKFELNNKEYRVEYEGLHHICFLCGCYGHSSDQCSKTVGKHQDAGVNHDGHGHEMQGAGKASFSPDQGIFGPWMLVTRDTRRKKQVVQKVGDVNHVSRTEQNNGMGVRNSTGSRFSLLQNENVEDGVGNGYGTHQGYTPQAPNQGIVTGLHHAQGVEYKSIKRIKQKARELGKGPTTVVWASGDSENPCLHLEKGPNLHNIVDPNNISECSPVLDQVGPNFIKTSKHRWTWSPPFLR